LYLTSDIIRTIRTIAIKLAVQKVLMGEILTKY
jgi:hypothetical protein